MTSNEIILNTERICDRLNELNNHDDYRFVRHYGNVFLRDLDAYAEDCCDDNSDEWVKNPLAALCDMESASDEMRKYGMPFIVLEC